MTYRSGVSEEASPVSRPTDTSVWRCYDRSTGAYLGVVSRGCRSKPAAEMRGAHIYGVAVAGVVARLERE